MAPTDKELFRKLFLHREQLQRFRNSLDCATQAGLDDCEWNIVPQAGHQGLLLVTIKLPSRVCLQDPFLYDLASQIERQWGPVDFALFSGETSEPVRVLSRTLLDQRWYWHRQHS